MRKPMVTRTMTNTKCVVLGMNLETAQPEVVTVTVPRTYKTPEKLFKAVSAMLDNDAFKAVKVQESNEVETRYGMSQEDFIKYAHELTDEEATEEATEE